MALEEFSRSVEVQADRERTWEVLTDVEILAGWVGIVHSVEEIRHLERYRAVLQDKVGPFKLRADLAIVVTVEDTGRRVAVSASGRDRAVDSKIKVDAVLALSDRGEGTEITVTGSYQVTGKVAGMGSGVIHKKADRILDDFFGNVSRELKAAAVNGSGAS
ncbi:CoxG family protein [Mycobacterium sp. NPDC003449]